MNENKEIKLLKFRRGKFLVIRERERERGKSQVSKPSIYFKTSRDKSKVDFQGAGGGTHQRQEWDLMELQETNNGEKATKPKASYLKTSMINFYLG